MLVSEEFEQNLAHVLGEAGRAWIDRLPALLAECAREYGLTIGEPFGLSYNYVAPVTLADGSEAVLKLSPHGQDFRYELRATELFGGHGMARLLASDAQRGFALLERLRPGVMLVTLDAEDAGKTEIAAGVLLELRRDAPPDHGLPTAGDWFSAFAKHRAEYGGAGPLPKPLFERGEATYADLLASYDGPPALLHGDLQHYNVLSAGRAPWLAIDPHGLVGEPAFDTGALFGNPMDVADRPDLQAVVKRRADILSERLALDRQRVVAWGLAYQVLSAVWSAENGGTRWGHAIRVAEALASIS
jgi:streptomycin 6-kinase